MPLTRDRVGPYRIERPLGSGGMGAVYLARHESLGRVVALKVLDSAFAASDDTALNRFRREARTAMEVVHPNLVRVWDYGEDGEVCYLAMEPVNGRSLREVMDDEGPLPVPMALGIAEELLSALEALHAAGCLHRDLKPLNVMLEESPSGGSRVRLLDLGLVRVMDRTALTAEGLMVGSPRYIAPEMIQRGESDARTDIYQVGVVFYEMLAGRPPYENKNIPVLFASILTEPPPPLSLVAPEAALAHAFLARTLRQSASDRFPSATEALRFLRSGRAAAPADPASTSTSTSSSPRTRSRLLLALPTFLTICISTFAILRHTNKVRDVEPETQISTPTPGASPGETSADGTATAHAYRALTNALIPFASPGLLSSLSEHSDAPVPSTLAPRISALLRSTDLPALARAYRDSSPPLLQDPWLSATERSDLVRRISEVVDLADAFRYRTGRDPGLPVDLLAVRAAAKPPGATAFAQLVQNERFGPTGGNFLNWVGGQGRKWIREPALPVPGPPPREVWLEYKISEGGPTEKVILRVAVPGGKAPLDQAILRAPGEGFVQLDARVFAAPTAHVIVAYANGNIAAIPKGVVVQRLALYLVR